MSRYKTISRPGENVSKHDSPSKEPIQDRLEESDGRSFLKALLQNVVHTPCLWINLPQWRRLGEENNLPSLANHLPTMDLL